MHAACAVHVEFGFVVRLVTGYYALASEILTETICLVRAAEARRSAPFGRGPFALS